MGDMIIEKGFPELDEVWGVECTLRYPGLYAGQTDMCGVYQGRESIIDFKQSNKPKRDEWIMIISYNLLHMLWPTTRSTGRASSRVLY